MENLENERIGSERLKTVRINSSESQKQTDLLKPKQEELTSEVNNYLKRIATKVVHSENSNLINEYECLNELLTSFRRLNVENPQSSRLNTSKKHLKLPEIYAILRPDIYNNSKEDQEKRLIRKTGKRTFNLKKNISTPITAATTTSPLPILQDRRQNEKDRFCKLLSSAPSKLNYLMRNESKIRPLVTKNNYKLENIREKEKDRLAKIFSRSSFQDYSKPNKKHDFKIRRSNSDSRNIKSQSAQSSESDMCKLEVAGNQENINPLTGSSEENMVRVGEYSPLNGNYNGKTELGIGEHDEQNRLLTEERRREYLNMLAAQNQELSIASPKETYYAQQRNKPRVSSASTQTDSEDSVTSNQDNTQQIDFETPVHSVISSPTRRRIKEFSPREKLLSDLYGSSRVTNYRTAWDEKDKQIAYAKALREQIEEKKRLEEERRRREREEEEIIERRVREQAERLHAEFLKEQNKKSDWLQQRQAQEEALRKRFLELELESKELKKQDRQKKLLRKEDEQFQQKLSAKRSVQKRFSAQSSQIVADPSRNILTKPSLGNVPSTLPREQFVTSPLPEYPPLLDSDKQNILSIKANELKRGGFNELNENDNEENSGAFALVPGMNLLTANYQTEDGNGINTVEDTSLMRKIKTDEIPSPPMGGYIPSVGQMSPNSGQQSWRPGAGRRHAEQILQMPLNDRITPLPSSSNNQPNRSPSPVVPALQTEMLLKESSKILDNKWKISTGQQDQRQSVRTYKKKDSTEERNILTQLGEFRRRLAAEHKLLEQRLKANNS